MHCIILWQLMKKISEQGFLLGAVEIEYWHFIASRNMAFIFTEGLCPGIFLLPPLLLPQVSCIWCSGTGWRSHSWHSEGFKLRNVLRVWYSQLEVWRGLVYLDQWLEQTYCRVVSVGTRAVVRGKGRRWQPRDCCGPVVDSGVTVSSQLWLLVVPLRGFFWKEAAAGCGWELNS